MSGSWTYWIIQQPAALTSYEHLGVQLLWVWSSGHSQVFDWWARLQSIMFGWTQLHSTSLCCHEGTHRHCKVSYSGDPMCRNFEQNTPLHLAAMYGNKGSKVSHYWTVLHAYLLSCLLHISKNWLPQTYHRDNGCNPTSINANYVTALHLAVIWK